MQAGDRVRLKPQLAKTFISGKGHKVDWRKRRGTVISLGTYTDVATIQWDDRVTRDYWPIRALRVCDSHKVNASLAS